MGKRGPQVRRRPGQFETVRQVRGANRAGGFHFFDRAAMAAFGSKVERGVHGGRYVITSEQDPDGRAWDGERRWTIREAFPDGDVRTVGTFGAYRSRAEALDAVGRLVEVDERGLEVRLCDHCVYLDANGWDDGAEWEETYTGFLPTWAGWLFGPVVLDEELEPTAPYFSWAPCDGCGDSRGGQRHDYVAVRLDEVERHDD